MIQKSASQNFIQDVDITKSNLCGKESNRSCQKSYRPMIFRPMTLSRSLAVTTSSQPYRYCPLLTQRGQYLHGWVRVVTKWYQSRSLTSVWGLFGPAIPWDTTRTLCLHGGVFVMSQIGYGRMFLALYMQRLFLTKQARFKAVRAPLGPKQIISTWLGASRYKKSFV